MFELDFMQPDQYTAYGVMTYVLQKINLHLHPDKFFTDSSVTSEVRQKHVACYACFRTHFEAAMDEMWVWARHSAGKKKGFLEFVLARNTWSTN